MQSQSVNWVEIARGLRQITVFGPLLVQCPGGTELRSDFAVINQMTNEVQLNGNVSFVDSSHTLTSSNAAYNSATGRLYATGNVVLARKTDGYTIRVPELEYFSRQPGRE